jgi:hypothetical protein
MMAPSSSSSASASCSSFSSSASAEWSGRLLRCSYKRATFVLCTGNIVVAFFMLHATLAPLYLLSSSPPPGTTISSKSSLPFPFFPLKHLQCDINFLSHSTLGSTFSLLPIVTNAMCDQFLSRTRSPLAL